ncbi:DsbA family protein [Candidatus Raskinella chloraquaticus]|jgi:protein-disulfide isomerase
MRMTWLFLAVLGCFLSPAIAQDTKFDPAQKQAFESLIRDYLLKNPQVLREALVAMDRHEREQEEKVRSEAVAKHATDLFSGTRSAVLGNPNGDVTIVEFFDYNCGYCKRSLGDVENLLRADPGLRLVLKEFPVLGRGSVEAAQISAQLINNPRFHEFHTKLLGEKNPVDKKVALSVAQSLGFDTKSLEAGMTQKPSQDVIEDSLRLADNLNLNGTPTYVIGNEVIVGAVGIAALRQKIQAVRKCGKSSC